MGGGKFFIVFLMHLRCTTILLLLLVHDGVYGMKCFSFWRVPSLSHVGVGKPYSRITDCGRSVISCVFLRGDYPIDDFYVPHWKLQLYTGGCGPNLIKADLPMFRETTNATMFPCPPRLNSTNVTSSSSSSEQWTKLIFYANEIVDDVEYSYQMRMQKVLTPPDKLDLVSGASCADRVPNCHDAELPSPEKRSFEHEPFDCDIWHQASVCFGELCNAARATYTYHTIFFLLLS